MVIFRIYCENRKFSGLCPFSRTDAALKTSSNQGFTFQIIYLKTNCSYYGGFSTQWSFNSLNFLTPKANYGGL